MPSTGEDKTSTPSLEALLSEPMAWINYALKQLEMARFDADETVRSAFHSSCARLSEIGSTASAHSLYTLEMVKDCASEAEDVTFTNLKEGVMIAAANPAASCGILAGLGIVGLKRPRHYLFRHFKRLFMSEESLLSSAEAKTKAMKQSFANLQHEGKKLEERATVAENVLLSGRIRLRQTGQQIQGLTRSIYRVEKEANGLKDVLSELPSKDSLLFRSKISGLTTQVNREKRSLGKEIGKITGFGISI
ncbi:hypothetical protein ZOSMA_76G00410 [Zostera marina]|uniref:Uncharacterized protein n=1 Tax=Zostera marina TaxID=29655 RepID=A0A0K9NR73_ZOSMR|nr:hypothetical protein ZOSMA_76G00410 [Zostera marina]